MWLNVQIVMLLPSISANILFTCTIFTLASGVHSQTASDDSEQSNEFRSCSDSSYCTPIRKCSSFPNGWNRRGVGITCGHGYGPYRKVCCPRIHTEEAPVRRANHSLANRPTTPTQNENKGDCGASQGVDWFQEHMTDYEDIIEATWPWMAAIILQNISSSEEVFWCSGILIDKTHVLTVAHCFSTEKDNQSFTVKVGSDDLDSATEHPVSKIKIHEGHKNGSFYDDIAILTLAREVDFPNFVPICLPDEHIVGKELIGWGATVVGWGRDEQAGQHNSILKQLDNIPIVSHQQCKEIYEEIKSPANIFTRGITREMLCAGKTEGSMDACMGDAGAPLMILDRKRWFVAGLSSFGYLCGQNFVPAGYTNVSNYVNWIRKNIKD